MRYGTSGSASDGDYRRVALRRAYPHLKRVVASRQIGHLEVDLNETDETGGHARERDLRLYPANRHGGGERLLR